MRCVRSSLGVRAPTASNEFTQYGQIARQRLPVVRGTRVEIVAIVHRIDALIGGDVGEKVDLQGRPSPASPPPPSLALEILLFSVI